MGSSTSDHAISTEIAKTAVLRAFLPSCLGNGVSLKPDADMIHNRLPLFSNFPDGLLAPKSKALKRLTQVLPKAGFKRPTTLTVLPQRLTGTCTGTCTTLPVETPDRLSTSGRNTSFSASVGHSPGARHLEQASAADTRTGDLQRGANPAGTVELGQRQIEHKQLARPELSGLADRRRVVARRIACLDRDGQMAARRLAGVRPLSRSSTRSTSSTDSPKPPLITGSTT